MSDRFDLSPLDPFADPARRERFVGDVMARAAFELARRRRGATVWTVMAAWARPALAAAALAVLASVAALRSAQATAAEQTGVVEALAVPTPAESWLLEEREPTTEDLVQSLEGGTQWAAR
jgi:hypothetical protein